MHELILFRPLLVVFKSINTYYGVSNPSFMSGPEKGENRFLRTKETVGDLQLICSTRFYGGDLHIGHLERPMP
jgi:hypothetical protein